MHLTWWRHQMETFSALLASCAGNSPVPGEFPAQRPGTRGFDVFFDLHLTKRLSKQWWGWWFVTPLCSLWRHRNDNIWNSTSFEQKLCWCFTQNLDSLLSWILVNHLCAECRMEAECMVSVPCYVHTLRVMYDVVGTSSKCPWNITVHIQQTPLEHLS